MHRSGNVYEGEWLLNERHGKGTMHWYDMGECYTGEWVKGIQHGQGEHMWIIQGSDNAQVGRYRLISLFVYRSVLEVLHVYGESNDKCFQNDSDYNKNKLLLLSLTLYTCIDVFSTLYVTDMMEIGTKEREKDSEHSTMQSN